MTTYLYSGSLERHMKKYLEDVQLQAMNEEYHQAQLQILRQAQMMGLSPQDAMNKISQMPQFNTDAPEAQSVKEVYSPPNASSYENSIKKKPIYRVENRTGLIDELKDKLRKREVKKAVDDLLKQVDSKQSRTRTTSVAEATLEPATIKALEMLNKKKTKEAEAKKVEARATRMKAKLDEIDAKEKAKWDQRAKARKLRG